MIQEDLLSPIYNQNSQQNLPNATAALVLGILSIIGSFCGGIGIICGIIGLVLANKDRRLFKEAPELYSYTSFGTSNAGRTCSIIGVIISTLMIVLVIFYVIMIGHLVSSNLQK